ncbi:hypothetical protein V1499_23120 (plasmid) [Neobacillus sp. SCS-31]|uniref:VgrG-related protein n=1 Tax=Neobacillus oceani TaxID=3115292 RepID=UPI0039064953
MEGSERNFTSGNRLLQVGFSGTVGGGALGSLSKKYESGSSGPGTVARNGGDWGGASYGTYQIATNTGTMNSFIDYLKKTNPAMHQALSKFKPGTKEFDTAWKALAATNYKDFDQVQHAFIKSSHYDPAAAKVKKEIGLDINSYSPALQNVLWSTAVQHGAGGAVNVFKGAGIKPGMSEAEIIKKIYYERMAGNGTKYFGRSSPEIRQSVVARFNKELKDALSMLG